MSIKGYLLRPMKEQCPYLPGKTSINENMLIKEIDNDDMDILLALGFRHFGEIFFRPSCPECRRCIPIRIPVDRVIFTKSVRRLFNRSKGLDIKIEEPEASKEAFALYRKHKRRFKSRYAESYDTFVRSFFHPPQFAFNRVLSIKDGNKLVALTHLDVTEQAMSAIYCYFDENYKQYSPGKLSIYKEIEIARELCIPWLYLGFYVPGNRHMRYKIDYKPNQLMDKKGEWLDYIDAEGNIIHPLPGNFY